ncbi:NAD-dependent epimerase/dehydratase family protein [Tahibacter soli]|uniref:NAD-dependent epimerase/dehydratase family protein n=1 Tax=Tahibacter soli TaxID=2983605 RepID=A0A9X3YPX1_9GAMM|nr:NAD-dependent epimerase/dehydratase family protein [Tahibacter soli]MDC8014778.1 NAD-dependent epimerase/dehydratase family protein [Tahibacter soli]
MIDRRNLLKLGTAAAAAWALRGVAPAAHAADAAPGKPLRILILGGTGFTGPHQVRYALARGHKVTLFNRGKRAKKEWPGEVEELHGDRNTGDLAALKDREWDVCIDNPTTLPFWVRDAGKVLKSKVGQYVFISTISVYESNADGGADENAATAKYDGKDAMAETQDAVRANMALYGPLKARSEQEVHQWFKDKATIIRPGLIVGPGDETDRFSYWPVRIARGGEVLAPGNGDDPVQFIDARDLAEWSIRMAERRVFGTFNATGPDYKLSTAGMLYGIRATTTAGAQFTWVPADFLEAQKVAPWGDMPVWIPAAGDSAGFASRSIKRALEQGLTFRPLATTAGDTLAWFGTLPAERQAKLKAGLTAEREKEVLDLWKKKSAG